MPLVQSRSANSPLHENFPVQIKQDYFRKKEERAARRALHQNSCFSNSLFQE
jgi:hypothetical protein